LVVTIRLQGRTPRRSRRSRIVGRSVEQRARRRDGEGVTRLRLQFEASELRPGRERRRERGWPPSGSRSWWPPSPRSGQCFAIRAVRALTGPFPERSPEGLSDLADRSGAHRAKDIAYQVVGERSDALPSALVALPGEVESEPIAD